MVAANLQHLICLARDPSQKSKNRLVIYITKLLAESDRSLNPREQELVNEILKKLIAEVERPIRSAIAQILAEMDNAPQETILLLGNEEIDIAAPILMKSSMLLDEHLIEIIQRQSERHQLAIAMRQQISEQVSAALIATDSAPVIQTLLENDGAHLSPQAMTDLIQKSRGMVELQEPLLRRRELSFDLAAKMYVWVSQALREYIVTNFAIEAKTIDPVIARTVAEEFTQLTQSRQDDNRNERTANILAEKGQLSGNILLETLKQADIELFEALFAKMANISTPLAHHLIYDHSAQGITVAAKAMGLDRAEFTSLFLSMDRANMYRKNNKPLTYWLKLYDRLQKPMAKDILAKWQDQFSDQEANSTAA